MRRSHAQRAARAFARRARAIRLLTLDVDGVLTDGHLHYSPAGEEWKVFHVRDGLALVEARGAGLEIAVVSARASVAVARRMAELGIREVHQGVKDKSAVLADLLRRLDLTAEQVAYMGDDLPDLPVLTSVGLALATDNAVPEVKRVAHWVSRASGGAGAVREAVEAILRARAAWPPPTAR
ncbi:MAG: KdsC family phosphatase [Candidatus Methylomirabilia bacterium]